MNAKLADRIRVCNEQPIHENGKYILYWMIANRRLNHNAALEYAAEMAVTHDVPLLVLEEISTSHRFANDRICTFMIQGMLDNFRSVLFSSCHRGSYRRPCHPTALCDSVRQCNALTPKRAPSLSLFRSRASRCCIDHECAHGLRATLLSLGAFKCSARPEPSARLCVRGIIARAERGNSVQLIRSERISISRLEITAQ